MTSSNIAHVIDTNSIEYDTIEWNGVNYLIQAKYSENDSSWYFGVCAVTIPGITVHANDRDDDPRTFMSPAKLLEMFDSTRHFESDDTSYANFALKTTEKLLTDWVMSISQSKPLWCITYSVDCESPINKGFFQSEKNAFAKIKALHENHTYFDPTSERFSLDLKIFDDVI